MNGWKRTQFTDCGPDPTCSVTWAHKESGIVIMEFQGIYSTDKKGVKSNHKNSMIEFLGKELHQLLESQWEFQQDVLEQELAEAGYPDHAIYGGE